MVELYNSLNSCNTYEGRSPKPGSPAPHQPLPPLFLPPPRANCGAIQAKKLPLFKGQRLREAQLAFQGVSSTLIPYSQYAQS